MAPIGILGAGAESAHFLLRTCTITSPFGCEMSKQHFKALAQASANARPSPRNTDEFAAWRKCVIEVGEMCAEFCDEFNHLCFIDACAKLEAK